MVGLTGVGRDRWWFVCPCWRILVGADEESGNGDEQIDGNLDADDSDNADEGDDVGAVYCDETVGLDIPSISSIRNDECPEDGGEVFSRVLQCRTVDVPVGKDAYTLASAEWCCGK